jgi:hypothetical protein
MAGGRASQYARGGIINFPHYGLVGEDGPEAIIPLTKKDRGLGLLKQTASILGYNVESKNKSKSPTSNIYGQTVNISSTSPVPTKEDVKAISPRQYVQQTPPPVRQTSTASAGKVDNSFTIEKVEVRIDGSGMPGGKANMVEAKKQAQMMLKEMKKIISEEKSRAQGTKTLEQIIMSM